ncbi:MAG: putative Ig domain-containing protein [Pseudomonadota bacterium]
MNKAPKIISQSTAYAVKQNTAIDINIANVFSPQENLRFSFIGYIPPWLQLSPINGMITGKAPKVTYDKVFKISVLASNAFGYVSQHFTIKVLCTDIVDTMPPVLANILSLRKSFYGYHHLAEYTPDLLEYIYCFYQQPEYQQDFNKSFKEFAEKYEIDLDDGLISYKDFKKTLEKIYPKIEENLRKLIANDSILFEETISNAHLRNLFRQGSAPSGVIPIPLWNHLAAPSLHNWDNWNPFENILDRASDEVRLLKLGNLKKEKKLAAAENNQQPTPSIHNLKPQLKSR